MAEKFLSGATDLDGFLEEFLKKRKDMHLLKAKSDKMAELLSRRNSSYRSSNDINQHSFSGYPQLGYPHQSYYQPASTPYPSVPNMPMPGNPFINRHF